MKMPPLTTHDGRRSWAFLAVWGGCVVFTIFAAVGVWLVSGNLEYTFYLALAAHAQVVVGLTAMGWQMGRRVQAEVGKDGVKLKDGDGDAAS